MMKVWLKYHSFPPVGEQAIWRESLWHNERVSLPQQDPMLQKRWTELGIQTIQDVCHEQEGRLLSHREITERYGVPCTFLDALRLRLGIPLQWRSALTPDFAGDTTQVFEACFRSGATLPINTTSARRLFSEIIPNKRGIIRSQNTWNATIDVDGQSEWREIYLRPFSTTRETKLQSFRYRLNHRLITCNRLLLRYRIKESDLCSICDQQDTLEHFFFQCPSTRRFWALVFQWIKSASNLELDKLSIKEILLGVPADFPQAKKINFFLLTSRFFIHRQRLFHAGSLSLIHWINELRTRLLTERQICLAEGKPHKFNLWQSTLEYTG